jgi:hypothetical protein
MSETRTPELESYIPSENAGVPYVPTIFDLRKLYPLAEGPNRKHVPLWQRAAGNQVGQAGVSFPHPQQSQNHHCEAFLGASSVQCGGRRS